MRKPSPAMMVALASLFVALSGVGVAATGGSFILGQSNAATTNTALSAPIAGGKTLSLTNADTTNVASAALGLTVASGHAPLTVSSTGKVKNLNADLLDGIDSAGFLRNQIPVSITGSAPGDVFDVTNTSSGTGNAISGTTPNGTAAAIHGSSGAGRGVEGLSGTWQGVYGHSSSNAGVVGESTGLDGVWGQAHGTHTAGVSGHNDKGGFALWGDGGSVANGTAAVHGQSANGNAVEGITQKDIASGVYGENDSTGYGVAGRSNNGTGVLADSSNGWALNANGNATQARAMGGLVKAIVYIGAKGIQRCFNSQLPPSQATSVPCGITYTAGTNGVSDVDFGFQINDRFISISSDYLRGAAARAYSTNVVRVTQDPGTCNPYCISPGGYYLFVY